MAQYTAQNDITLNKYPSEIMWVKIKKKKKDFEIPNKTRDAACSQLVAPFLLRTFINNITTAYTSMKYT